MSATKENLTKTSNNGVIDKPVTVVDELNNVIEKINKNIPTDEGNKRDCLVSAKAHIEAAIHKINKSKE